MGKGVIYQHFVGRHPEASIAAHEGDVFQQLSGFNWRRLVDRAGVEAAYLLGIFDNSGPILVAEEQGELLGYDSQVRVPSPFALCNHAGVNPRLGAPAALRELIDAVHRSGGTALVDFVANHTAINHPWIKSHPEYYVRDGKSADGLLHEFSGDVVKLDYGNPDVSGAQIEVLKWIASLGVDGVRCDMAHFMPLEFWHAAIGAVKADSPGFCFIAEAYPKNLFDWSVLEGLLAVGFDAVYHGSLYRNLEKVFVHGERLEHLVGHLNFVAHYEHRAKLVHYLANHDDSMPPQIAPLQEGLMSLLLFLPGTTLIYNGQLNGLTRRLKHHAIDILPAPMCEFQNLPAWFQGISRVKQAEQPLVTEVELACPDLVRCSIEARFGRGVLYVNLSRAGRGVEIPGEARTPGIINGFMPGEILPAGKADLFVAGS